LAWDAVISYLDNRAGKGSVHSKASREGQTRAQLILTPLTEVRHLSDLA
jgi:hypothetical protein